MQNRFAPYRIRYKIYESARTLVLAAVDSDGATPVVLKAPQPGQHGEEVETSYAKEVDFRRALAREKVDLKRCFGMPLLVIHDPGRESLRDIIADGKAIPPALWLSIALGAVRQLKKLHAQGVLHRDLHPGNLLFNPQSGEVALVDFELAVPLVEAQSRPVDRRRLEGALPYMAPESTGRMNIGIDERSDLYALGASLYELLVAKRPFPATDPAELVHQHLALKPAPPTQLRADIPVPFSQLIMKLLEKSPDQRYQSARGLEADLCEMQAQFQHSGSISEFTLGCRDIADSYRPGVSLFGRDEERSKLQESLEKVGQGGCLLYMLAGYSGIGKSALARKLREPALLAGGIFVEGKCDQYLRLQPFSAWAAALDAAVSQILVRPKVQTDRIRQDILAALGKNGRLLTDLVPALESLLGPQPPVSALTGNEAQNRLRYVFVALLEAMARCTSPLILFLDDLQWMDAASLELLQAIASSDEINHLLVLGAFRDNEVDRAHPLQRALKAVEQVAPGVLRMMTLGNLKSKDLRDMIASNLNMAPRAAEALALAVHAKTAGNPFFSHQMLKTLADTRVLHFNEQALAWEWDPARLDEMPLADNVVDLLVARLHELPRQTQALMSLGACIGNRFALSVLAGTAACSSKRAEKDLLPALQEGFLLRDARAYQFGHDRIQQAAYKLVEPSARVALHLKVGRSLLAAQTEEIPQHHLFDIVSHFEQAQALLDDDEERQRVTDLAVLAARRADAASAHDVALRHYRLALVLAGEEGWTRSARAHWGVYLDAIQSEFHNAQHERVEEMIQVASDHVSGPLDRIELYELECRFAIARNDQQAAIGLSLDALGLLGFEFADTKEGLADQAATLQAAINLSPQRIAQLAELVEMEDPEALAAMRVMVNAAGAAYVMRPDLWEVLTLQLVQTTLRYGKSPLAAFAYGFYAVLLAGVYQDIEAGYAFGRLSEQTLDRYKAEPLRAKIINLFDVFVRHWKEHLRQSVDELPRGLQSGIDHGDFEYGSYNAIQHGKHQVICGYPLNEVIEQQQAYLRVIDRLKMGYHLDFARIWRQLALNLNGRAENPFVLAGPDYNAAALVPELIAQSSNFLVFNIHCTQAMLAYFMGQREAALDAAEAAAGFANYVPGMAEIAEHNFFHSLCLLAATRPGQALHNRGLLRKVARNQRQLGFWAQHAPMNFRHKYLLVEAERIGRSGRPHRAVALYEQAIRGAQENLYLNDQALATELFGEFMLGQGHEGLAALLISDAIHLYRSWQAYEKENQLKRRWEKLLQGASGRDLLDPADTDLSAAINIDVQSTFKAAVAISRETRLEPLKQQMMSIVAENAGAQAGLLVLRGEQGWVIAAEFFEGEVASMEKALSASAASDVPQAVLTHVMRHKSCLLLDDAAEAGSFEHEPYLQSHQVRSVLCMPLLQAEEVTGVLYLENRHAAHAFSQASAKVIEILAAQAMVAIEKARLLDTLEQRVRTRTRELRRAKQELEQVNLSLASSEERFRLAMRATSEGVFDWNLENSDLFLSPGWKRMLGYADHELENGYETWQQLVDPDQRDSVLQALDAQLRGREQSFELEHRLQHRDGHWVQVMTRASIVRDEEGRAIRLVGSNVDVTAERRAQAEIQHQALHDPLTGLPNRALFTDRLEEARKALHRNGEPFALHLLDLDKFKLRNDTYGHQVGDEILRQTADRIREQLRQTDTAARLGGDEFAVIQIGADAPDDARALAEKLIQRISTPIKVKDIATDVGCSIGIRLVRQATEDVDVIISEADAALYRSKDAGRGVATVHDAAGGEDNNKISALIRSLPVALSDGQMQLAFQPVVALSDGEVIARECLLRWNHPQFGVIPAASFIPDAEKAGLAATLNAWVVGAAARYLSGDVATPGHHALSINIATHRVFGSGFADGLLQLLADNHLTAQHFTFEFGSSLFAADPDLVRRELDSLKSAGARLAIQGIAGATGPLLRIHQWGIDELKLDAQLTARLAHDEDCRLIVKAILAMANTLGVCVTATGIESQAERDAVNRLGCNAVQGYFIAPPVTAGDIRRHLH